MAFSKITFKILNQTVCGNVFFIRLRRFIGVNVHRISFGKEKEKHFLKTPDALARHFS